MSSAGCTLVLLVVIATDVHADSRSTTVAVTVRKRPGEKAAAVGQLPAGSEVVVLREEGRWLFVKSGGVEGYLTRTTVTPVPIAVTPSAASWGSAYAGGELRVVIAVTSASLRDGPAAGAAELAKLPRGQRVDVVDATSKPGWVRVSDDASRTGWLARADVANTATEDSASGVLVVSGRATASTFRRRAPDRLGLRLEVGAGFRTLGMDLTSNATGGLTNFIVDANAVAVSVRANGTLQLGERLFAGIDSSLVVGAASPGIRYPGPSSAPGRIPFQTIATEVGARLGVRARKTFALAVRFAGHYDAFLPEVENVGTLPRERLLGLVAGARVDVVPQTTPISAELRLDALVLGSRAQTPGLEDGTASEARALAGGVTLRFSLGARWSLFGDYEFGRVTTEWTGMSVRQPGVTGAERVDTTQSLQLGVSAEL